MRTQTKTRGTLHNPPIQVGSRARDDNSDSLNDLISNMSIGLQESAEEVDETANCQSYSRELEGTVMEPEEAGGLMDPLVYSMAHTTLFPEQIPSTVLHVYNLPYRIRWQDLKDLFRLEGTPIRAEVYLDIDGRSRGMGTVAMSSIDEAERCVRVFDGYEWFGRGLRVTMQFGTFASDNKHQPPINVPDPILPIYTLAGTATTAQPAPPPPPILPIPYYAFQPHPPLPPAPAATFSDMYLPNAEGGAQVHVGNLPFSTQWQDLKDLLRPAGRIVRADIAMSPDGKTRGFGTALFVTPAEAATAIDMFDGYLLEGRALQVRWERFGTETGSSSTPEQANTPIFPPSPSHTPTTSPSSRSIARSSYNTASHHGTRMSSSSSTSSLPYLTAVSQQQLFQHQQQQPPRFMPTPQLQSHDSTTSSASSPGYIYTTPAPHPPPPPTAPPSMYFQRTQQQPNLPIPPSASPYNYHYLFYPPSHLPTPQQAPSQHPLPWAYAPHLQDMPPPLQHNTSVSLQAGYSPNNYSIQMQLAYQHQRRQQQQLYSIPPTQPYYVDMKDESVRPSETTSVQGNFATQ